MLVVPKLCIAPLVRTLATLPPPHLQGGVVRVRISVTRLCSVTLIRTLATSPPPPSPPSPPPRLGVDLAPLLSYCATHSTPLHPVLRDLQVEAELKTLIINSTMQEFTLARGNSRMMAAPEVLALNSLLIQVHIKPKR